jgi:carboxypeptidase C (cathepsin A)
MFQIFTSKRTQVLHIIISGYEEIDWYYPRGSSNMFYTLFGAFGRDVKTEDDRIPLLIWLQGGPGASSQFGAFTEIGPV